MNSSGSTVAARCARQKLEDPFHERALSNAVLALTQNHRQVLELAYVQGLSQSEIALRIDRPVGTIKTWSRTALKNLRQQVALVSAR